MKLDELRSKLREMFDPKVEQSSKMERADTTPKTRRSKSSGALPVLAQSSAFCSTQCNDAEYARCPECGDYMRAIDLICESCLAKARFKL